MIPLFSSLPPKMNRFNESGDQIGESYYQSCLESWDKHGFSIISINAEGESQPSVKTKFNIERISLSRDARAVCGRPLVYFSDFLRAAYHKTNGPIVITNADIELDISDQDLDVIASISRDEFICEARLDYPYGHKDRGVIYQGGFDFFVFHRDHVEAMLGNELVFGMPWWDHYVPVFLTARGLRRRRFENTSRIYHLDHEERWDMERFFLFGNLFRKELDRLALRSDVSNSFTTMLRRIEKIELRNPHFPYPRRKNFLKNLLGIHPKDPLLNHMLWIAAGSLRLIENPADRSLARFSLSRFMHRLPF